MYIKEGPACSAASWHTGHAASVSRRGKGEAIVFGDVQIWFGLRTVCIERRSQDGRSSVVGSVHAGDVADVGPRECPFARVLAAAVCRYGAGCARFARVRPVSLWPIPERSRIPRAGSAPSPSVAAPGLRPRPARGAASVRRARPAAAPPRVRRRRVGEGERSETKSVKSGSNRKEGAAPGPKPHRGPVLPSRCGGAGRGQWARQP